MKIGVFDSGIGGINVLKKLIEKYPNNHYIYFGDTLNIPYGEKSIHDLERLSSNIIEFLLKNDVDLIVIACGTVSSNCYHYLKNKYDVLIYDIISPTIDYLNKCQFNNIGVIGTSKTIESNIFNIKNKNVLMKKTPSFVPIIENNLINEKKEEIKKELSDFLNTDILVLGCTHYPLLKPIIDTLNINTLDMGECLVNNLNLSNDSKMKIDLYFSKIDYNLMNNLNINFKYDYQIHYYVIK